MHILTPARQHLSNIPNEEVTPEVATPPRRLPGAVARVAPAAAGTWEEPVQQARQWDAPWLLLPWFEHIFLRVMRTHAGLVYVPLSGVGAYV
jgi:hypothetical protein